MGNESSIYQLWIRCDQLHNLREFCTYRCVMSVVPLGETIGEDVKRNGSAMTATADTAAAAATVYV